MTVVLHHTIVGATDNTTSARFLAGLLGLRVGEPARPLLPVAVNEELTLEFDDRRPMAPGHYGFLVDDATFDALLTRLAADPDIRFGSGPAGGWNRSINRLAGGRGVYVADPDGHSYEFFTTPPPS